MTNSVINAWTFLEAISPGEIDKKLLNKKIKKYMFSHDQEEPTMLPYHHLPAPWEKFTLKSKKFTVKYRYYMMPFSLNALAVKLRQFFSIDEEMYTSINKEAYSYVIELDSTGNYIPDSLFVPHLQLVLDDLFKQKKIGYDSFTSRFNEARKKFEEEIKAICNQTVTSAMIQQCNEGFNRYFSSLNKQKDIVDGYVEIVITKVGENETGSDFNSFYLSDLDLITRKGENHTLRRYIEGQEDLTINMNENRSEIEALLHPTNLPLGRWPSPYRLSLMQQVAVQHIINGNEPINSVNGPPGTGKTTLLKDIFADLIVQRAMEMVKFENPAEAFTPIGQIKLNNKNVLVFELNKAIARHKMVVASSNNGAVENISKDLPKENELNREGDNPFDIAFRAEYEKLDLYKDLSKLLIDHQAWGVFSAPLGKSANFSHVAQSLQGLSKKKDVLSIPSLSKRLFENQQQAQKLWKEAINSFNKLADNIEQKKQQLAQYVDLIDQAEGYRTSLEKTTRKRKQSEDKLLSIDHQLQEIQVTLDELNNQIDIEATASNWEKFISWLLRRKNSELERLRLEKKQQQQKVDQLKKVASEQKIEIQKATVEIKKIEKKLQTFNHLENLHANMGFIHSSNDYWQSEAYEERQKGVIWQTDELNQLRGRLFIRALRIHQLFIEANATPIHNGMQLFYNRKGLSLNHREDRQKLQAMWNVFHLVVPVVSTTFASFSSMYQGIEQDFIDYLFVDEAGQARPQEAVGAMWRSKRAIVVGDPIQIEPVVTMHQTMLKDICNAFGISERYISLNASVQVLADCANPLGTYKGKGDEKQRIGIPLWVHRRCLDPMFSISNRIAYEDKMVLGQQGRGKSEWFNIVGNATKEQYVPAQGEFLIERLKQHVKESNDKKLDVYIIAPFSAVAAEIRKLVKQNIDKGNLSIRKTFPTANIGTVHTFQGKEASIVYFVTGTDTKQEGAANWSCQSPNLINVAVTRAKKEFYVIGDLQRFEGKPYYKEIVTQMNDKKV